MSAISAKNTKLEIFVRQFLFRNGLRYRIHVGHLPGRPDIVFPSRHLVIFVHGCFWHGCSRCVDGRRAVKSNSAYWLEKIRRNKLRDVRNLARLQAMGWQVLTIWECECSDPTQFQRLVDVIRASSPSGEIPGAHTAQGIQDMGRSRQAFSSAARRRSGI